MMVSKAGISKIPGEPLFSENNNQYVSFRECKQCKQSSPHDQNVDQSAW